MADTRKGSQSDYSGSERPTYRSNTGNQERREPADYNNYYRQGADPQNGRGQVDDGDYYQSDANSQSGSGQAGYGDYSRTSANPQSGSGQSGYRTSANPRSARDRAGYSDWSGANPQNGYDPMDYSAYSRERYARVPSHASDSRNSTRQQRAQQQRAQQQRTQQQREQERPFYTYEGLNANQRSYSRYDYGRNVSHAGHNSGYAMNIPTRRRSRGTVVAAIIAIVVVALIVAIGVVVYVQSLPVPITLNGAEVEVGGEKTIQAAMEQEDINPTPGNLVAVDGSVLALGEGELLYASLNGEQITDTSIKLTADDVVEVGDGADIMEPYDTVEEAIPYEVIDEGHGAIHVMEGTGTDGIREYRTGQISGITTDVVTREVSNIVCRRATPDVGEDKVVALTFDDGPWPTTTAEMLDVLDEYGVKATFFTVGTCIDESRTELVQRADAAGHQICTHTYDHADGSGQGVNLGYMTAEEQIDEVEMGFDCIINALGHDVTRIMRAPGGNFSTDVMVNVHPYVVADIGWNIDTEDWKLPGVSSIVSQITSAWPGAIILMHDGGGDRSQTVEALREALPVLIAEGYSFVTIDELMQYDLITQEDW